MKIKILGAGWYGCHLARSLLRDGHDVSIYEPQESIFQGASGKIPARLHLGPHYPRSFETREACQRHTAQFMSEYGFLTRAVPLNIYAIAAYDSFVDYRQYVASLKGEFQFIEVHDPGEYGLQNVEGAILVPERHILADQSRLFFETELKEHIFCGQTGKDVKDADVTIDCTFCAQSDAGVDRYEPCLVLLMKGETYKAVTIMDGPFGSLYPWDPARGLCSLSSALHTPFTKSLRTYEEALSYLCKLKLTGAVRQGRNMIEAFAQFYPQIRNFKIQEYMLSIRAMPRSGADTRLVSVVRDGDTIRVRAGKIDAVLDAEKMIKEMI